MVNCVLDFSCHITAFDMNNIMKTMFGTYKSTCLLIKDWFVHWEALQNCADRRLVSLVAWS